MKITGYDNLDAAFRGSTLRQYVEQKIGEIEVPQDSAAFIEVTTGKGPGSTDQAALLLWLNEFDYHSYVLLDRGAHEDFNPNASRTQNVEENLKRLEQFVYHCCRVLDHKSKD